MNELNLRLPHTCPGQCQGRSQSALRKNSKSLWPVRETGHSSKTRRAISHISLDFSKWDILSICLIKHVNRSVSLEGRSTRRISGISFELDRPGPHYTLDTVEIIVDQYPDADITPIIGSDSLREFPTWRKPKEILYACHWVGVMRRPGEETNLEALERQLPGIRSKVHYVDAPLLEIASREIRERVATGKPFRYYLAPPVYEYIEQHHLYQESNANVESVEGPKSKIVNPKS